MQWQDGRWDSRRSIASGKAPVPAPASPIRLDQMRQLASPVVEDLLSAPSVTAQLRELIEYIVCVLLRCKLRERRLAAEDKRVRAFGGQRTPSGCERERELTLFPRRCTAWSSFEKASRIICGAKREGA